MNSHILNLDRSTTWKQQNQHVLQVPLTTAKTLGAVGVTVLSTGINCLHISNYVIAYEWLLNNTD